MQLGTEFLYSHPTEKTVSKFIFIIIKYKNMKTKINPRITVLLLIIVGAASTRFISIMGHTPLINFTPIGAMALFGGSYFTSRWKAIVFPLITLFISDLVINGIFYHGKYGIMYQGWYFVYAAFVLMVFFGKWILTKVSVKKIGRAHV